MFQLGYAGQHLLYYYTSRCFLNARAPNCTTGNTRYPLVYGINLQSILYFVDLFNDLS